ncbi:MAG: lysophospholipid acyltransferase family protein [Acidimicrobiia bacterium]
MPEIKLRLARSIERVLRLPNHMLASAILDLEVTGKRHVPSGPVVIAANHFSHLDPYLIGTNLDRFIRFLAVDQLYGQHIALDATLNFFGAIPLDRDGYPVRALRAAIDHLESGDAVGLFPEGRRVEAWGINAPKNGAAWLAWMTGAPLVPVAIHGTEHTLGPAEKGLARTAVRIWIERPLWWYDYVDRTDPLTAMMDDWYHAMNTHLEPWETAHE